MKFHPIRAFKNPSSRPRAIIWTSLGFVAFLLVWAGMMLGTSTYWFCTVPCHIVHDDNTLAYNAASHSRINCIACHEPVNADPIHFTMIKISVAPDAWYTIRGEFEIPVNPLSILAMETPEELCTQCHTPENRAISPTPGMKIDHKIHRENKVQCTFCHNRAGHNDDAIEFVLEGGRAHENWMRMDACFRCHSQEPASDEMPTGNCNACHTSQFELMPASHEASGWYALYGKSGGHADAAKEETKSVTEAAEYATEEGYENTSTTWADVAGEKEGEEPAEAEKESGGHGEAEVFLRPSSTVNSCYTCHRSTFCSDCHGVEIPHSEVFNKDHSKQAYADPSVCAKCHADSAEEAKGTAFCDRCHHDMGDTTKPWFDQHPPYVKENGTKLCYECHGPETCSICHVRGRDAYYAEMEKQYKK